MATDARGHTVPAAGDVPSRNTLLTLALSLNDPVVVTNTTTRAALATAVSPTSSRPLLVYRVDARPDSALEYTTDGTNWKTILLGTPLTSYTPALTATGTNPTLGTGATQVGAFLQFGNWAEGYGEIVFGTSGFAAGTGTYRVSLPVTLTAAAVAAGRAIGDGEFFDASASNFSHVHLVASTTTTATLVLDGASTVSATTPVVPANNDQIRFKFATEVV